ncbi:MULTISPECIES: hypothetical protein [Aliarcobacter]|jgi:hypothetical protein|uniref:Uncharacterized protein n=4 Tax=Arcobacteraceae TaxID=2808963 RepID=A0A2S9SPD9_9BACT|nr:hypothetical protein [Aliarcobacter cryaerophilus]NCB10261.1 hypothetical protein [Erysipelotrichia bacterium]OQA76547.1 MAG: hypothetical protein BWY33_00024 [Candidatus Dependentiae bacterium ADurb.Bin246]WNL27928.1 hypothetical protein RMQ65_00865 [Arcobacter sp. AZ-2023]WPD04917.1 hypothetical protein QUR76_07230 [Arcobacter sp. DSM 115956]WPD07012.1 hypothetical protein QUR78_07230 [Arcobacter sp. DSM 115955]
MRIDNNLNAMLGASLQIQEQASNIAQVANTTADPQFQDAAKDITSAMVEQIPEIIAYSANAKSIEIQAVAMERLLDLKA